MAGKETGEGGKKEGEEERGILVPTKTVLWKMIIMNKKK